MKKEKTPNCHEGHRKRLREKFDADRELTVFREHEVLEFILSLVIPRKDTNELAHELINKFGSLTNVFMATVDDLIGFKNMTTSAAYLLSVIYPAIRISLRTPDTFEEAIKIGNYAAIAEYMQPKFIGRKTECIAILYISVNYKLMYTEWVEGAYPQKISVDGEAIAKRALKEGAKYVVFSHNHPSQELTPSNDDIIETSKVYGVLAAVGIDLVDSLIFSDTAFVSFKSLGVIGRCDTVYYKDILQSRDSLQSSNHYNRYYPASIREYILNYHKLKENYQLEMIPSTFPLKEGSEKDPRNK